MSRFCTKLVQICNMKIGRKQPLVAFGKKAAIYI